MNDTVNSYAYNAESEMTSAAGVNYLYDGDGRRVAKLNGSGQPTKVYWYGSGGSILAETNNSGATTAEYIFFGGQRMAMLPSSASAQYYVEDMLGSSRVVTTNTGVVCYDADFYPYGGERTVTDNCPASNKSQVFWSAPLCLWLPSKNALRDLSGIRRCQRQIL